MTDWCILTTASSRTIPLADALAEAGFAVWTPTEVQARRHGRSRKRTERKVAMVKGIVFAPFARLHDLTALAASPSQTWQSWDAERGCMVTHGVPYFSVFRYLDRYPAVADRALDPLRAIERRSLPKATRPTFAAGDTVRYPDAGFEGLTGTVRGMQGNYVVLEFPGLPIEVKIDARYVLPHDNAA